MEYAKLGNTNLAVSRICMGCMGFGDARTGQHSWTVDEETTRQIIKRGLELGINFFDTAIAYQGGTSEMYLGRAIRDFANREDVVIATKFLPRSQEEIAQGISGQDHVRRSLEASLSHLGMDYIDLYIYHMWDWNTPVEEYLEGLAEAVKEGKVRHIGIANCFAWQLAQANAIAREHGWPEFVSVQNHYNLIMRQEEVEMNVYASEYNIALTPYSALAAGRLSKRPGETSKRLEEDSYARMKYSAMAEADAKVIEQVQKIADARGVSMTEVSLAWLLTRVTAPIVGAVKLSHVEGAVKAVDLKLTDEEIQALEEAYVPHSLSGVMAQNTPAARSEEQVWIQNGKYAEKEGK
ncbi:MAG: aldo/keto reductase [Erysipelotrichaceae bacterium]|nr:aldo/keto reductase [Erysipelotrichaceae bacterium]